MCSNFYLVIMPECSSLNSCNSLVNYRYMFLGGEFQYTMFYYNTTGNLKLPLTHWGWVAHICKLTIIDSDKGAKLDRRQTIIWTNVGILLIGPLGKNFSEILIKIYTFSFRKMHLKMSSGKWRPFCFGLNVLTHLRLVLYPCIMNWIIIGGSLLVDHCWFR